MPALRRFLLRLASPFRSSRAESELAREIEAHLQLLEEQFIGRGMSAQDAKYAARRAFGGVEQVKEHQRDTRSFRLLDSWWLDFKLGARMLVKYPGITLVGGLAIAFGIAVGAATFEFLTQVLHPRLPLDEGHRIVAIRTWDTAAKREDRRVLHDVAAWRTELASIEDVGGFRTVSHNLAAGDGPGEPIEVAEISASAFRLARVSPLFGRSLIESDERTAAPPVVLIGHDVWQRRFNGDATVVGRTIRLGRTERTVVGVMPEGFRFPVSHDVWIPLRLDPMDYPRTEGPALQIFGRLAPTATMETAQAELATLARRAAADFPATHASRRLDVMPYATYMMDVSEISLGIRAANAFVVLFIVLVCANVATLVFARAATRHHEIVVRNALGASRGRIIMQLFTESLVLAGVAAVVGLATAGLALRWWLGVAEAEAGGRLPFWLHGSLSATTLGYAAGLTVLGALVSGVLPAIKVTGRRLEGRLREGAAGARTLRFGGIWTAVIVAQVAATVAFPATAFFVRRTVLEVQNIEVGFPNAEYLSARLEMNRDAGDMPAADRPRAELATTFRTTYKELERRLTAEPGVTAVTFTDHLPRTLHPRSRIQVDNGDATTADATVSSAAVGVNYFDALGAGILAGRNFHAGDAEAASRVAIVNHSFAEQVLQGRNPVGRRLRYVTAEPDEAGQVSPRFGPWLEIVGVAPDLGMTIGEPGVSAGFYVPAFAGEAPPVHIAIHLAGEPESFVPRLRAIASSVDPTLRLHDPLPLDEVGATMWMEFAFLFKLLILISAIALLLSLAGIYAVMSFTVSQRTREIGIRIALGAGPQRITAAIFARAFRQVGAGVVLGGLLVAALTHVVSGLAAKEVLAVSAYLVLMLAVCSIACIVPTRRALRIEPTEALRADT